MKSYLMIANVLVAAFCLTNCRTGNSQDNTLAHAPEKKQAQQRKGDDHKHNEIIIGFKEGNEPINPPASDVRRVLPSQDRKLKRFESLLKKSFGAVAVQEYAVTGKTLLVTVPDNAAQDTCDAILASDLASGIEFCEDNDAGDVGPFPGVRVGN